MADTQEMPCRGTIDGTPLKGQHAIVTGATRGIGVAIAETLARLGARVSLLGRNEALLDENTAALKSAYGVDAISATVDVTDSDAIAAALDKVSEAHGAPHILVNNAGAAGSAPFGKITEDHWNDMLRVNLTGPFLMSQAVFGGMAEAGYGRIINVASTSGLKGYAYVAAYAASKHGVVGLTRSLALEAARTGVTVNAVCPGFVETDIVKDTIANIVKKTGRSEEDARKELERTNPQARLVQPWEVAETVGWLALPASSSITGQSIIVAGGEIM